VIAAGDANL
jgi:hypothetical protein